MKNQVSPSIRSLLMQILGSDFVEEYGVPCTVKSVDAGGDPPTCVCTPINDTDPDFIGVRLQAAKETDGILLIPVVGSVVMVQPINHVTGYVSMFSKVESIRLGDGTLGGLIKIADLVNKLNNLENKVNSLITAYNTHTHTGVTTGAGTSAVGTAPVSGTLTPTVRADIENDTITHGEL